MERREAKRRKKFFEGEHVGEMFWVQGTTCRGRCGDSGGKMKGEMQREKRIKMVHF